MKDTSEEEMVLIDKIRNKSVLYIATKNADYLRVQQEINLVKQYSLNCKIIVSGEKKYWKRLFHVYKSLLFMPIREYDVIFVGFMAQMIIPVWGWKLKSDCRIVDFFISVYDTLVDDRKKISKDSLIAKAVHWIDQRTIGVVDWVVSDTRSHGQFFSEEFKVSKEKVLVLYLEADSKYYYPMKATRPIEWKDKFLALYFGSILPLQGVDVVLQAIELLRDRKEIHFIVIGPIADKYKKVESDTVTYIEWLSQEELARYIAYADLCLAGHFSADILKADRTIPGKAYIYEAMRKKIVLGDSSANRELYCEDENHIFVEKGNAEGLAQTILNQWETGNNGKENAIS